jgi:hypothetical protein
MIPNDQTRKADRWDAEFRLALGELREAVHGIDGSQCALIMDHWEIKYRGIYPHLASTFRDTIIAMQAMLLKNPGTNVSNFYQNNSNFQQGSNAANSVGNIAAGQSNTVNAQQTPASTTEPALAIERPLWLLNIGLGTIAGSLAAWWWLPDEWALGRTRLVATIFVAVAGAVAAILGWFQFRRGRWEKMLYASLAVTLIVRSSLPTIGGWLGFAAKANPGNANPGMAGFLFIDENPWLVGFQIAAAVVLCAFAWSTKSQPFRLSGQV